MMLTGLYSATIRIETDGCAFVARDQAEKIWVRLNIHQEIQNEIIW